MKKQKNIVTGKLIEIKGSLSRHKIVKKVVDTFITTEYHKKGKGVTFRYPVENLPNGHFFIARPGHKKNFDFKVDVVTDFGLGEGSHLEIAQDLREKKNENRQSFKDLLNAITEIYNCAESDVDKVLKKYPALNKSFQKGAKIEIVLKVVKWLFIMEDIVYWDNEGRAFLFNFLRYVAEENDDNRLKEAIEKVKNPDRLKSFMKKAGIDWMPCENE
ncbi:MAG: hypothetical protein AB1349_08065 [Elusimicrobiota bacterium]